MEVDCGDEYSNDLQVCEMREDEASFGNRSGSDLLRAKDAKVQLAGLTAQIQGEASGERGRRCPLFYLAMTALRVVRRIDPIPSNRECSVFLERLSGWYSAAFWRAKLLFPWTRPVEY